MIRYKIQQDKGIYCLKGCEDGDLVDYSQAERLQKKLDAVEKALREAGYVGDDLVAGIVNLRALYDACRKKADARDIATNVLRVFLAQADEDHGLVTMTHETCRQIIAALE